MCAAPWTGRLVWQGKLWEQQSVMTSPSHKIRCNFTFIPATHLLILNALYIHVWDFLQLPHSSRIEYTFFSFSFPGRENSRFFIVTNSSPQEIMVLNFRKHYFNSNPILKLIYFHWWVLLRWLRYLGVSSRTTHQNSELNERLFFLSHQVVGYFVTLQ